MPSIKKMTCLLGKRNSFNEKFSHVDAKQGRLLLRQLQYHYTFTVSFLPCATETLECKPSTPRAVPVHQVNILNIPYHLKLSMLRNGLTLI